MADHRDVAPNEINTLSISRRIGIRVVHEGDGLPVPGRLVRVELEDGSQRLGVTDLLGEAHVAGIGLGVEQVAVRLLEEGDPHALGDDGAAVVPEVEPPELPLEPNDNAPRGVDEDEHALGPDDEPVDDDEPAAESPPLSEADFEPPPDPEAEADDLDDADED